MKKTPGLYCLQVPGFFKIGKSDVCAYSRSFQQIIPCMKLAWVCPIDNASSAERVAHKILIHQRVGKTDWFEGNPPTLEWIEYALWESMTEHERWIYWNAGFKPKPQPQQPTT